MDIVMKANAGILIPEHVRLTGSPAGLGIWARYEVELYGADGRLRDRRAGPSRSFLRNFGRFVRNFLLVAGTSNEELSNTSGQVVRLRIITGALAVETSGRRRVVVGTGKMRFGNGTAAIQSTDVNISGSLLGDGAVTATVLQEDSVKSEWKLEGQVTNNTGTSFNVNEVALLAILSEALTAGQSHDVAMLRDLVSPAVPVANGLTVLGRYTFTIAV